MTDKLKNTCLISPSAMLLIETAAVLWNRYVAVVICKQAKLEGLKICACILKKKLFSLLLYGIHTSCRAAKLHDVLPYKIYGMQQRKQLTIYVNTTTKNLLSSATLLWNKV